MFVAFRKINWPLSPNKSFVMRPFLRRTMEEEEVHLCVCSEHGAMETTTNMMFFFVSSKLKRKQYPTEEHNCVKLPSWLFFYFGAYLCLRQYVISIHLCNIYVRWSHIVRTRHTRSLEGSCAVENISLPTEKQFETIFNRHYQWCCQ
jgi:hypothetical protein